MSGREIMFYIQVPLFRLHFVVEVVPGCSLAEHRSGSHPMNENWDKLVAQGVPTIKRVIKTFLRQLSAFVPGKSCFYPIAARTRQVKYAPQRVV
jgi:hypothetical protein